MKLAIVRRIREAFKAFNRAVCMINERSREVFEEHERVRLQEEDMFRKPGNVFEESTALMKEKKEMYGNFIESGP